MQLQVFIFADVPMSDNSDNSSDSVAVIGGAVGGVILLLMIIVVLYIVILCMRRSCRKKESHAVDNTAKLNTDVTLDFNPSYDVIKTPGDSDTPVTTNLSYNVHTKPYSKTSEDEYNYVQPNDVDGYIKIHIWLIWYIKLCYSLTCNNAHDEYNLILWLINNSIFILFRTAGSRV